MNRVATLTDEEYKVILAIREASHKTAATSPDLMRELDAVIYELESIAPYNWEEVVDSVRRRIYGLLR